MFAFAVSLITVLDFFETRESLSVEECSSFSNTRPLKPKYLLFSGGPGSWLRLPLQRYGGGDVCLLSSLMRPDPFLNRCGGCSSPGPVMVEQGKINNAAFMCLPFMRRVHFHRSPLEGLLPSAQMDS